MTSNSGVLHLKTTKQTSVFRGFIFAIISGVSFSIVAVLVKLMKNLHPGQLALYQFIASFVMFIPETTKTGQNPFGPPKFRLLLVGRALFGGLNIFLNFIAFRYLGLGEASVIIFSSPVVTTIFARIFFKEPCNIIQSISVILIVIGITFTTKLPSSFAGIQVIYSSEKIYGLLAALSAMFSVSFMHLITRKLTAVPQAIINFNYSWIGILELVFLTALFGKFNWPECGMQRLYMLVFAMFSYIGVVMVVMALQCEYAGPVTTVRAAADIIMAFVWQIFIFHDVPDLYGIIGAASVSVSIILIGLAICSIMVKPFPILLLSSLWVTTYSLLCQDSSECKKGSKLCQVPNGDRWCCNEKVLICEENSQCSFLIPYLPFIQLRPGTTESESSHILAEDKIFFRKYAGQKIKSTPNFLLNYHCKLIEKQPTFKPLELVKPKLDISDWKTNVTDINCPGRKQRCPPQNTCCLIGKEKYGCCRYTEAVCCSDFIHCCPPDTVCNTETMECTTKHLPLKMDLIR